MAELTKEQLEQILEQKLKEQTKELKSHAVGLQEELARMVAEGFTDIQKRLDVKERLEKHEKAIQLLAQYADIKEIAAILK